MKKLLLGTVLSIITISLYAQTLIDTLPHNRKVVLEEYTGIHCQYCPDGHKIANQIKAANPDKVFLINIHQGSYATPAAGEPNFKTSFGDSLAGQTGLTGYPAGTVNRHLFGTATTTALSRSSWSANANTIMTLPSYCNVGVTASADIQTRLLTVNVEVYYTGNGSALNLLNLALIQNNVQGPQIGGSTWNPTQVLPNGNYNHQHMLRHLITGQWGDPITNTAHGSFFQKTYTYTLPANINSVDLELGSLEVVAFIAEGKQEIISGAESKVNLTGFLYSKDLSVESITSFDEICAPIIQPTVKIKNYGSDTVTSATFTYSVNGGADSTYNWTGSLLPYSTIDIAFPNISSFSVIASNSITINVTAVNNGTDQNTSNNSKTKSNIVMTTNSSNGANGHVFTFVQDRYGSESTWKIIEDATNTVVASGGPYTDLSANGTAIHTHNITFNAAGCYTVMVYDAYGDGINSGFGAGNYKLVNAANQTVISSTGQFGKSERKVFNLTSLIGIDENNNNLSLFSLTPNPAKNNVQLSFNLNEKKEVSIKIFNSLGAEVYNQSNGVMLSGNHTINLNTSNLSSGIYYLNVNSGDNFITKKLVIE